MKLTRYLYEKSYVEYSLLISLLERDSEKSLFWAYELYFSGFKTQVFSLIWKYYYLLYGCFHVRLERYMKKKTEQWLNNKKNYIILGTIVFNMSTREPCIDSYLMMQNIIELPNILTEWTTRLHNAENPIIVLEDFINKYNCYKTKGKHLFTVTKETIEDIHIIDNATIKYACIARMMSGLFLLDNMNNLDGKLYLKLNEKYCRKYETKPLIEFKSWKIPENNCLFHQYVPPNKDLIPIQCLQDWINYCWYTPLWKKRIQRYNGQLYNNKIYFEDEDDEEKFYNFCNLEPDEQTLDVLQKWYGTRIFDSWQQIHDKYYFEDIHNWFENRLETVLQF